MKIGIFTDSHYSSAECTCGDRYNSRSLEKIREALAFFKAEHCELVLSLGDLIDRESEHQKEVENLQQIADTIVASELPFLALMGNHDAFAFTVEEFYNILGQQYKPKDICDGQCNLIFLDTCYFTSGMHYMPGDSDWTNTFLPNLSELKEKIAACSGKVYVFSHQNIDPTVQEQHIVANATEICDILEQSGKVRAVYQGHYHPGNQYEQNGILYRTFPAMCSYDEARFIVEL